MSKDKHKKRDRMFAFIRSIRSDRHGSKGTVHGEARFTFSRKPSKVMRECLDAGLAKLRRVEGAGRSNRRFISDTMFDADMPDEPIRAPYHVGPAK